MGKIVLINPPKLLNLLLAVARPFLQKSTLEKLVCML